MCVSIIMSLYRNIKILLLIFIGLLAYANSFHASFQYDDYPVIVNNYAVYDLENLKAIWRFYPARIMGMLSFALNYHFNRADVWGYHLVNFMIHLVNAFLVWWLVTGTAYLLPKTGATFKKVDTFLGKSRRYQSVAFFAALLFLIHPLQTQAVTYIYQRVTALATLFYLASLCFYLKARVAWDTERAKEKWYRLLLPETGVHLQKKANLKEGGTFSEQKIGGTFYFALALAFAVCAMFTKEISITLPLMIVGYELFFFPSYPRRGRYIGGILSAVFVVPFMYKLGLYRLWVWIAEGIKAWFAVTAAVAVYPLAFINLITAWRLIRINFFYFRESWQGLSRRWKYAVWIFIFIVLMSAAHKFVIKETFEFLGASRLSESHHGDVITWPKYALTQLRVMVLSWRLFLFPVGQNFYWDIALSQSLWDWQTSLSLLAVLGVGLLAWTMRLKAPLFSFGIFWFFVTYLSIFIPRQHVFFEHWLYLPSVGLCMAMAAAVAVPSAFAQKGERVPATFAEKGVHLQKTKIKFNEGGTCFPAKSSWYPFVLSIIIIIFSVLTYQRNKIWQTPKALWQDVVKKSPRLAVGYHALGGIYYEQGLYDTALTYYDKALNINPRYLEVLLSRGRIYKLQKNYQEALADFNKVLDLTAGTYQQQGYAYNYRGDVYYALKRYDLALEDYSAAIGRQGRYPNAFNSRGMVYILNKDFDRALKDFNAALQLNPQYASAYSNRGVLYMMQKKYNLAVEDFQEALKINPQLSMVSKNLTLAQQLIAHP